ncbi:NAD-dependent epimerase [Calditrichota bacterium]
MAKRILITGGAGFIGFHLSKRLLENGWSVISLDSVNDYYDPTLKEDRLKILSEFGNFNFHRLNLADKDELGNMFDSESMDANVPIVHLAAQAGVRYARQNPYAYVESNLTGFVNLIELAQRAKCPHMLYASSSSVYGGNEKLPYAVCDNVDHPVSLYAATKKSNELMAHVYSYMYGLPTTGLRFFTVYGPWGRPDMALFIFTKAILEGRPLQVFNYGKMSRDFTFVDDIVEGIHRLVDTIPQPYENWDGTKPVPGRSWVPYRVFNIGNHQPVNLLDFIGLIEKALGKKAELDLQPIQKGDVKATYADIDDLFTAVGFKPQTPIEVGVAKFVDWYIDYYKVG